MAAVGTYNLRIMSTQVENNYPWFEAARSRPMRDEQAGEIADGSAQPVARYLATSPRVSQLMIGALTKGTSAKIYGPLIANEIAKGEQQQQQ